MCAGVRLQWYERPPGCINSRSYRLMAEDGWGWLRSMCCNSCLCALGVRIWDHHKTHCYNRVNFRIITAICLKKHIFKREINIDGPELTWNKWGKWNVIVISFFILFIDNYHCIIQVIIVHLKTLTDLFETPSALISTSHVCGCGTDTTNHRCLIHIWLVAAFPKDRNELFQPRVGSSG